MVDTSKAGVGLALEQHTHNTLCYVVDIQPGRSAAWRYGPPCPTVYFTRVRAVESSIWTRHRGTCKCVSPTLTTGVFEGKVCRMYGCSLPHVTRCRWMSLYAVEGSPHIATTPATAYTHGQHLLSTSCFSTTKQGPPRRCTLCRCSH